MSKRIFSAKADPPLTTELGRTPICYYHKHPIINFCVKKKCTLPLCEQCLPIHKKEHINNKQIPNEGILQFETARGDALSAFQERKQELVKIQQKFKGKIFEYKAKMIDVLNVILDKFCEDSLVTDGNLEILAEIEERTAQIKHGSLKELIRYYEDIHGAQHFRKLYKMYTGQYLTNFKFEFEKKILEKFCKDGIKNLNFDTEIPIVTQASENVEEEVKPVFQGPTKEVHKPEIIKMQPKPTTGERNLEQKRHSTIQNFSQKISKQIISEEEESEITSYQLLKSKKKVEEGNIYTQNHSKITDQPWKTPSQNTSHVSNKSKSKKRKGLSLTKSHQQLPTPEPSHCQPPSQYQKEQSTENIDNRKSNWRKFVNMGETHPENQPNLTTPEPSTVLNPKQMRQIIIKKKMEQKQRELKVNKSAQFLVPPQRIRN